MVLAAQRDLTQWQALMGEEAPGLGRPVEVVDLNGLALLPESAPVVLVTTHTDLTPALYVRQVLDRPDWQYFR